MVYRNKVSKCVRFIDLPTYLGRCTGKKRLVNSREKGIKRKGRKKGRRERKRGKKKEREIKEGKEGREEGKKKRKEETK